MGGFIAQIKAVGGGLIKGTRSREIEAVYELSRSKELSQELNVNKTTAIYHYGIYDTILEIFV